MYYFAHIAHICTHVNYGITFVLSSKKNTCSYNNSFRFLHGLPRYISAREHQVLNNIKHLMQLSAARSSQRRDCDRYGLGSKPTRAILLCPWERHFTALSPAWWSWQAALIYIYISINFQRIAISLHLRKQVGVIAYSIY